MNSLSKTILAAATLAMASCGGNFLDAGSLVKACVTIPDQVVTIAPSGALTGSFAAAEDVFVQDFLSHTGSNASFLSVPTLRVTVRGTGANFDWLDNITVTTRNAGGSPVVLGSFTRGAATGVTTASLDIPSPAPNLFSFVTNGTLPLAVQGHTTVPAGTSLPSTWTASIYICVSAVPGP